VGETEGTKKPYISFSRLGGVWVVGVKGYIGLSTQVCFCLSQKTKPSFLPAASRLALTPPKKELFAIVPDKAGETKNCRFPSFSISPIHKFSQEILFLFLYSSSSLFSLDNARLVGKGLPS